MSFLEQEIFEMTETKWQTLPGLDIHLRSASSLPQVYVSTVKSNPCVSRSGENPIPR